ncbi:YopX family protein [Metabacillus fastidiosus]|uniref:YopX family protein n=1 Tax=Metabacillus fastidiosus TaxID=1458 RepID=UPI000825502D|nr:YopX family protein [Metabacillus fastidiosus]
MKGDICNREIFAFNEIRTFTGQVKMFEGCWWIGTETVAVPLWDEMHELEVIGNIYENPRLLNS